MKFTVTNERSRAIHGHNASRTYQRHHGHGEPIEFHGIDTEGMGEGSDHRPVLISCGRKYMADADGLEWWQVFEFLYSQFQPGGHAYVGYYLAYDFTQWLKTLPENRARMLLTEVGRMKRTRVMPDGTLYVYPVGYGTWEFDLLGHKRLRIRPKKCVDAERCKYPHSARKNNQHRWMYICDVGPFFQCSFLAAIHPDKWPKPVVTRARYAKIEQGKERRSDAVLDREMIDYQKAEIVALEKLMNAQQSGLREMDVFLKPKQWFGPGQIAQELLKKWDVPGSRQLRDFIPEEWLKAAQATYYGGWFEIFAHGHVRKAWSYDINSAYPYIIAGLPCLRHGKWSHGKGKPRIAKSNLCIVRCGVRRISDIRNWDPDNPGSVRVGSMLHRDKNGRIFRPINTAGFYWLHEIEAAQRAGCIEDIEWKEWYRYEPCDCPKPMAEIARLYDWRLRIGKNTPLGKALKLAYNSIYGKLAQSIGHPKYGNAIYASLITAGCRTMILDAIATHPDGQRAVLMVATDGVYFLTRHPGLTLSKALGEWEEEEHDNLALFKPGVYWNDKAREALKEGKAPEFKARGVNVKDFSKHILEIDNQFRAWPKTAKNLCNRPQWQPKGSAWPRVEVHSTFSMVSAVQALQRNKWEMAGYVEKAPTIWQSSVHYQKRNGLWWDKIDEIFRSAPRWAIHPFGDENECPESYPYEKRFGMEDPWSDEMQQAAGLTPDGNVTEQLSQLLGLQK